MNFYFGFKIFPFLYINLTARTNVFKGSINLSNKVSLVFVFMYLQQKKYESTERSSPKRLYTQAIKFIFLA